MIIKRTIAFILILFTLSQLPIYAANSYITIDPYHYSTHILGEDLVIYGDTDFSNVTLGLFYPKDQGYNGLSKYIQTISRDELKNGYSIPTGTFSRLWPCGNWKVKVQYGDIYDEIFINMQEEAAFDRKLRVVEYENSALKEIKAYPIRGMVFKNNVLSFSLEDGSLIKIYAWNNLSPVAYGDGKVFVATYKDGYLTNTKTYEGTISYFGHHISLKLSENKTIKLFYWDDNLKPIQ